MAITIGPWRIDREQRSISDSHGSATLTPRSWEVLIHLLDHRGELVRTETLLRDFWRGHDPDKTYVRKCIAEIRRVLGDSARAPRYIRTIPKQGYVFVADPSPATPAPVRTLAVLPFVSFSSDPENEVFSDGLTEEIVDVVAQQLPASVIARTSAFEFKGRSLDVRAIGRALGASHVLEGSVRKAGGSIRVTAQLIDAVSGLHIWSRTYERELTDVFALQRETADAVSLEVIRQLDPAGTDGPVQSVYVSKKFLAADDFKRLVEAITDSMEDSDEDGPSGEGT